MSTETTNKKIKIDNGTTFGKTYTDKTIDAKLPTDLIASANKLSLGVGNAPLGNGVNLDGFTYDEATKTLKASGGESIPVVEGVIDNNTNKVTFNSTPSADVFLAHLLYDSESDVYLNSLITRNIVSFGDTSYTFYIGNAIANAMPYIICTFLGTDFQPSLEMRIIASMKADNTPGVVYFKGGEKHGFYTIKYGENGTYLKSTGNGLEWSTPTSNNKTISLFGKHSILVPKDSADTNILPLPADASTSTYVLKAVNGTVQWVKES